MDPIVHTATNEKGGPESGEPSSTRVPKKRGFAAMDPGRVSEIARKGGRAAHEAGTAHRFSAEEARVAGRKGGLAPHRKRRGKDT
jgi:general stress protein YciG